MKLMTDILLKFQNSKNIIPKANVRKIFRFNKYLQKQTLSFHSINLSDCTK